MKFEKKYFVFLLPLLFLLVVTAAFSDTFDARGVPAISNTGTFSQGVDVNTSNGDNDSNFAGDADANLLHIDATNDRVMVNDNSSNAKFTVSHNNDQMIIRNNSGAADEKDYLIKVTSTGEFELLTANDAWSSWQRFMQVTRTGNVVDQVIFENGQPLFNRGIWIADQNGVPATVSNYAMFSSSDVAGVAEAFAFGDDGLGAQLSSHNPITKLWYHHGININTGVRTEIQMEELVRELELVTGKKWIYKYGPGQDRTTMEDLAGRLSLWVSSKLRRLLSP